MRLAWITQDRQLAVGSVSGGDSQLLTDAAPRIGSWGAPVGARTSWSWPTWSPNGEWVAAFSVDGDDNRVGPVRVSAYALDGVRSEEWLELSGVSPIYLQWHPLGQGLTCLVQRDGALQLLAVNRTKLGQGRLVDEGVPLFFNWTEDGNRLLTHVGDSVGSPGRLVLRDPFGPAADVQYLQSAGSFCAPVFAAGRAVWATPGMDGSELFSSAPDGSDARSMGSRRGLVAAVAAPDGSGRVAVAHAPRGESTPYVGIDLIDLRSGTSRLLVDLEVFAFFWSPCGTWLLASQVASDDNCLRWWKVPTNGAPPVPLATFWPTRDLLFFLHFFDQYTTSHPLVSADGRYLTYAGYPAAAGQADLSQPPSVYVLDTLNLADPPRVVDQGSFAVFAPTA